MMFKCKICDEEYEDSGDVGHHLAFGHNLVLDTENPDGLSRNDFPPELRDMIDAIDKEKTEDKDV